VCDKGPQEGVGGSVRVAKSLLTLRARYGERVTLILGNRDVNKLRLMSELDDPQHFGEGVSIERLRQLPGPYWVPLKNRITPVAHLTKLVAKETGKAEMDVSDPELLQHNTKANRLRYILKETMGADGEFERRREELKAIKHLRPTAQSEPSVSDDDVVASFVDSVRPPSGHASAGGFMYEFIHQGQLAAIISNTLYVHGGITVQADGADKSVLGVVPGRKYFEDIVTWVEQLNEWKQAQLDEYKKQPMGTSYADDSSYTRGGDALMDYATPASRVPSVIMGRHLDAVSMPKPLPRELVLLLNRNGIERVVVGHTPHGDCPTIVRMAEHAEAEDCTCKLDLIMADTSYSDMQAADNRGRAIATVSLHPNGETRVKGTRFNESQIDYKLLLDGDEQQLVGCPERPHGDGKRWFVKAQLLGGDYLLCNVNGFEVHYDEISKEAAQDLFLPQADARPVKRRVRRGSMQIAPQGDEMLIGHDQEFVASRVNLIESIFKKIDHNHDGRITAEELKANQLCVELFKLVLVPVHGIATIEELFEAIDKDGSNTIELAEFREFLMRDVREGRASAFAGVVRRSSEPPPKSPTLGGPHARRAFPQ